MKKLAITLILIAFSATANAATVAFGYFKNTSTNSQLDYLATIFPNSFASAAEKSSLNLNVIRPKQFERTVEDQLGLMINKITEKDMPAIAKALKTDYYIYGEFAPGYADEMEIKVNMYISKDNRIFSFIHRGRVETTITALIDTVSQNLIKMSGKEYRFKNKAIPKGSNIAFLTNITDEVSRNTFIAPFMKSYTIISLQADYIRSYTAEYNFFDSLKLIDTGRSGYRNAIREFDFKYYYGIWEGKEGIAKAEKAYRFIDAFYYNYAAKFKEALTRINSAYNNRIDYLFVIGFDDDAEKCWVRCLDMKNSEVVWIESELEGSGEYDEYKDISYELLKRMTSLQ